MPKISVDSAEEGMMVADDICGPNGQLLLPAGISITAKHLRVLKTWGIRYIVVQGDDVEAEQPITLSDDALKQAEQALASRFSLCDLKHPVMSVLYQAALRQHAIAASRGSVDEA